METTWIRNPTLPGQEVEVPKQSLSHHLRAGWEEFTPEPKPPYQDPDSDDKPEEKLNSSSPQSVTVVEPEKKPTTKKPAATPKEGDK